MKPSADTPADKERDEGRDETLFVWNGTVARIPAPVQPAVAEDVGGAEGGKATPNR
jgi:hypothetical protein